MFVSPKQILGYGLNILGAKSSKWSESTKILVFYQHYGSSPLDLADIWYDLVVGDYVPDELKLSDKEKNEKGLKR